jgi:hypothetical protein
MFALVAEYNVLTAFVRRPSGTGSSGAVNIRWYDSTKTFISASNFALTTTTANVWESKMYTLSPPSTAVYAVVRLSNEGGVTFQYGSVSISRQLSTWVGDWQVVAAAPSGTIVVNGVTFTAGVTLRYNKDQLGYVWCEGRIAAASSPGGAGQIFFTLNSGFRPATVTPVCIICADNPMHCEINTNGQVKIWTGTASAASWWTAMNFVFKFPTR